MKIRVFIDTTTFIYAFEFPMSNSAKIINFLNKGEIEAIISEQVLKEVTRYFEKFHNIKLARRFRRYLLDNCIVIMKNDLLDMIDKVKGQIKEKDLEQLATTKKYGIKYLIAYDKDFEAFDEYFTPRRFLEILKQEVTDSEF